MAKQIDSLMKMLAKKYSDIEDSSHPNFLKHFLNGIIMIFVGNTKNLHKLFEAINNLHPSIKFTMSHTSNNTEKISESCDRPKAEAVTLCTIREGKFVLGLYIKPTDRSQYLLTSICHPAHCVENIPFSLALRINIICRDISKRDIRHEELKEMLLEKEYPEGMVNSAIHRAKTITMSQALKPVVAHNETRGPAFVTFFDPGLPNIQSIQLKQWRSMTNVNPYLQEVFPQPLLVSYKRQKNLKDKLVKAKVAKYIKMKPKRYLKGIKKCGFHCTARP